jgi:hypothetical protein
MLAIDAAWRLARAANIEAVGNINVNVLVRILSDAWPDDSEVLFALAAWRTRVDKCRGTWL